MASSNFFNGRTTVTPASQTRVDVSGLAIVGLGATGIVACLGEAEGGSPYNGDTPVIEITNPAKVNTTFRNGDLREAGSLLFQPSDDPDIPAGAQVVKFVKVNPSTQSTATLPNGDGDALTVTSVDYGVFTTQINLTVGAGTSQGKKFTITLQDTVEVIDDVGGAAVFTLTYTPGSNGATTMLVSLDPGTGILAQFTKTAAGEADEYNSGYVAGTGLDSDTVNTITGGAVVNIVSSSASDVQAATIIGTDNGTGNPVIETLTLTGTTPVTGTQQWGKVLGIVLASAAAGTIELDDDGDSDNLFQLTVGETTQGVIVMGPLEVGNGALSLVLDGAGTPDVIVVGLDTSAVAQLEKVALTGAVAVTTTASWSSITYLAVGEVAAARTITLDGLLWNSGDTVRLVSSSASDTQTAIVYGLDEAGLAQSETIVLTGTVAVFGTATWSRVQGVSLSAVAVGTISLTNDGPDFVAFSVGVGLAESGMVPIDNVAVHGKTVTLVADAATSQVAVLAGYSSTGSPQLAKVTLNGTTPVVTTGLTWSRLTGIAMGHVQAARTVTISGDTADLDPADYPKVTDVVSFFGGLSGWTTDVAARGGNVLIADMDTLAATTAVGGLGFDGDLAAAIAAINASSALVTAAAASGATGTPDNTATAVYLAGGVEGTTAFSDWQAALDVLRTKFVNTVTALTDDAAVHAAVKAHCVYMAGQGGQERDSKLGGASLITKTAAKAAAQALNTRHCQYCIQDVQRFNTDGVLEWFPPYFTALIVAGMQAGTPVGTPLTRRYISALDVRHHNTIDPVDDSDELINAGLLFLHENEGVGWRWTRNVTTYLIDNNPAYSEAAVNEAVNFTAYSIRTAVETQLGKKAFSGTANAILDIVVGVLTDLSDPNGQFAITSWANLTIEIIGDTVTIDVQVAPVEGVNFINTTVHLTRGSFAAAA